MHFLKFITQKTLLAVNIIFVVTFLIGCIVPFVPPAKFWPISFFGLALPYAFLVVLLFFVFWIFFHFKYCLVCLIPMIIGWNSINVFFAFHQSTAQQTDPGNNITVMSYNVRYFKNFDYSTAQNIILRDKIMSLIQSQHPDILCLQEFYTADHSGDNDNLNDIKKEMKLPYSFFSNDNSFQNRHAGVVLFSRYPIIHTFKTSLPGTRSMESAIGADIVQNAKDTFRVITVHLQSIYLNRKDFNGLQKLMHQEDTGLVASRIIVGKLRRAFLEREFQAQTVSDLIRQSPYPVILCGDFN
ncbi:MAG: endonuclease/exonuclease/phosphatase family protein, partial [Chitinophagaceae bacterium]